jgi:hypothetical protein
MQEYQPIAGFKQDVVVLAYLKAGITPVQYYLLI